MDTTAHVNAKPALAMTDYYELLQTPEAMKVLRALATSPSQARRLLREVGITDKNGELKPPYRTPPTDAVHEVGRG